MGQTNKLQQKLIRCKVNQSIVKNGLTKNVTLYSTCYNVKSCYLIHTTSSTYNLYSFYNPTSTSSENIDHLHIFDIILTCKLSKTCKTSKETLSETFRPFETFLRFEYSIITDSLTVTVVTKQYKDVSFVQGILIQKCPGKEMFEYGIIALTNHSLSSIVKVGRFSNYSPNLLSC